MGTDMRYSIWLILAVLTGLISLPARADFHVFACEPEWTALARVFIPDAHFTTATSYLQDPHYIEARPSLIAAMSRADIAVCTGASLEAGWLPALLQRAGNPDIQTGQPGLFFASDHAQLFAPHDHVDRSMGDVHPEGNPHVHLSPDQLPNIAKALAERLGAMRPDNSADIFARYIKWRVNWNFHRANWQERAKALQGRSLVIQHTGFSYLLRWLGIGATMDLEPKPGLPPSASHLNQLLADPRLEDAAAILIASHQNQKPAQWLSAQIRKPILVLPGTVTDDSKTDTLAELISEIINRLESAMPEVANGSL
ncbi:zinc ABC transporter substrate-binding protein [Marinobacter sp. S6332]|uniref:metal ABC transporter solute-binding protein, Zn/Mn family n=1 Tax=Marinobacter sp. S6332 TaxID=2926403 RepID=UPI001FF3B770|nr:zinc ABC transporter substrate-binding protein [Marinobacter sp. S6332]MCK0162749.1 zinc ABC transporter substrate-binding protein [Marinobacter sp. S6332]